MRRFRRHSGWLVTAFALAGVPLAADTVLLSDIEYAVVDGVFLKLDILKPVGATEPLPVVVFIHGGGWNSGDKVPNRAACMADRGYAVASLNYRLSWQAKFPAQIRDVKGAVRWLKAHASEYGLNPDRFGAWGCSSGGHLAALLATSGGVTELEGDTGGNLDRPSTVKVVCDWAGPTDFLVANVQALPCGVLDHDAPDSIESKLIGCAIQTCPELTAKANPITYVDGNEPPFIIIHGDSDCLIPPGQSQILFDALVAKGNLDAQLHFIPGAGHDMNLMATMNAAVAAFFDSHLEGVRLVPLTVVDVTNTLRYAVGVATPTLADLCRLGIAIGADSTRRLDILDAVAIARKVAGLEPNPCAFATVKWPTSLTKTGPPR